MADGPTYPSPLGAEQAWPFLAKLRAESPVYQLPDRPNVFLLTRFEDVHYAFAHPELFISRASRRGLNGADLLFGERAAATSITEVDGVEHKRKRDHAYGPVTPGRLKQYTALIEQLVDDLIDRFADRGEAEFVSDFAHPLPLRLMRRLMGLPEDDEPWLTTWSTAEAAGLSWASDELRAVQAEQGPQMADYLDTQLRARYDEGQADDVLGLLVRMQVERDGTLDLAECRVQAAAMLFGGIVTTAHFMASLLRRLLEVPDQLAKVRADRSLIPRMIEEGLRLDGPNVWNPRVAGEDIELGGVVIPKGAFVLLIHGSANRDDATFPDAARFHLDRANAREHLSFGYGAHFCLGAPLARLESRIAFDRLLDRLEDLRLAPGSELSYVQSPQFYGLQRLEIEFRAAQP